MLSDLLSAMVAGARTSANERARLTRTDVERAAASARPRGEAFRDALRVPGLRVIAECKRRSPSRGILRATYDPAAIAASYEVAGAAAISVLTDAAFFDGSLDHLRQVRAACALPVLRKDFVSTEFQIVEARAAGADAVLLIVGALDDPTLRALLDIAASLGLAALVEIHDREELARALHAGAATIGVNSRDLRTLQVDTAVFAQIMPGIPPSVTAVAESGLTSGDDLRRLKAIGYRAFLVGERFMTRPNPGAALGELLAPASTSVEAAG